LWHEVGLGHIDHHVEWSCQRQTSARVLECRGGESGYALGIAECLFALTMAHQSGSVGIPAGIVTGARNAGMTNHVNSKTSLGPEVDPKPLFRNAADVAADLIRQAIYEGRIEPGQRIKEEQFAEELGISRTPVREALLTLQAEHLLEAVPRKGVTVRSYSIADVRDHYDIRAMLEGYAAGRAARVRSDALIAALHENLQLFGDANPLTDIKFVMSTNARFHGLILDACASPFLTEQVQFVSRLPLSYHVRYWSNPEHHHQSIGQYDRLIYAIDQQDSIRAEGIMREHILFARDIVLENLAAMNLGQPKRTRSRSPRNQVAEDAPTS
jgi:DNA-binding GntR family transcriptional regulator